MWPFRRKSNRRQSRGEAETPQLEDETMRETGTQRDPGRHNGAEMISSGPERGEAGGVAKRDGNQPRI